MFSKILEKIYSGGVHEHKIRIMDGGESPVSSALIDGVNRQDYTLRHPNLAHTCLTCQGAPMETRAKKKKSRAEA